MSASYTSRSFWRYWIIALFSLLPIFIHAEDSLRWNAEKNRVDAQIDTWKLSQVLPRIARATGWQVYIEPGVDQPVSTKFKGLTANDALSRLFGKLSYVLLPQENGPARLYIFRTDRQSATRLVAAADKEDGEKKAKYIANELIVTLKKGAKIDDLAKQLGAKVTGRLDALGIYRLQFDSEEAANAARAQLANSSDVAAVDYNYLMDTPRNAQTLGQASSSSLPFSLNPSVNSDGGKIIIGLIDTPLQPMDAQYNQFLLKALSVAGPSEIPADQLTHATAMLETMLRSLSLSSPSGESSVRVLPVDVYGNSESTTTYDVAYGIYQAIQNGANIINLSLAGSGDSSFLHQLIQNTSSQGVLYFAAAGNDPVATPTYPAAYPEVVAVTAVDRSGNIASYANYGGFVDVGAPGTSLVSYDGKLYLVTGTSASTATVSGLAAALGQSSSGNLTDVTAKIKQMLGLKTK